MISAGALAPTCGNAMGYLSIPEILVRPLSIRFGHFNMSAYKNYNRYLNESIAYILWEIVWGINMLPYGIYIMYI